MYRKYMGSKRCYSVCCMPGKSLALIPVIYFKQKKAKAKEAVHGVATKINIKSTDGTVAPGNYRYLEDDEKYAKEYVQLF
jgi:hypothetical protein